jgi:predicted ATPase
LGSVQVKGIDHPVAACRVLRPSRIESRFEALHASGLTPLAGREEELQLLQRRWERAKSGSGQVVMICGEPGIGKSRVAATFVERIAGDPHTNLRHFCSPHHRDSALYPTASQIERAAGFERDDTPATKLDKLEALFIAGESAGEDRRLVAELLRLPDLSRYPALALNPQQRKHKTFDALLRQLDLLALRRPILYVFEDVHWIDPTSHELLDRTLERIARLPVLVVLTFRPEFAAPWTGQPNVTSMTLNRLDRSEGTALIERVGKQQLPPEIVQEIVERADGVPLFAEELTKAVLETEGGEAQRLLAHESLPTVPATLHASLMARLDRLGRAKEVAQVAAAIGRDVSYELLRALAPLEQYELVSALQQLVASGLLVARGTPPGATYLFKHALVQDAAYGTLLLSTRQKLHARIADVLESRFPQLAEREPEFLARHTARRGSRRRR